MERRIQEKIGHEERKGGGQVHVLMVAS